MPRLLGETSYVHGIQALALGVFEDLNRPSEPDLAALKEKVGLADEDFYCESDDPAVRALRHLVRAATTARQIKTESVDGSVGVAPPSQPSPVGA